MSSVLQFAIGYKFAPTNLELITDYLVPKLRGFAINGEAITEERIYALTPESLNWNHVPHLHDYERYYYVKRTPLACISKEKKNTKRSLESGEGYWRKSRDDLIVDSQNRIVGIVALLSFFVYRDDLAKTRDNAVKTQFIMHEFTLPGDTFQEWVICRIKDKEKEKNKNNYLHNYHYFDIVPQQLQQQPEIQFNPPGENHMIVLQPQPQPQMMQVPPRDSHIIVPQLQHEMVESDTDMDGFAAQLEAQLIPQDDDQQLAIASTSQSIPGQPDHHEQCFINQHDVESHTIKRRRIMSESEIDDMLILDVDQCLVQYLDNYHTDLNVYTHQHELKEYANSSDDNGKNTKHELPSVVSQQQESDQSQADHKGIYFMNELSKRIHIPQRVVYEQSDMSLHGGWLNIH